VTISAAVIIACACVWAGILIARELKASRGEAHHARVIEVMAVFAPGIAAAAHDPRALLTWHPLAAAARKVAPDAFEALDRASGSKFPFSAEQVQAAHAKWTAEWLAWERTHDTEYKLKAAIIEAELAAPAAASTPLGRQRLEAVEREKLELYQRRYEEYVRVAKALQALL
jgi:hypothetical protein